MKLLLCKNYLNSILVILVIYATAIYLTTKVILADEQSNCLNRDSDPVVITGDRLEDLNGSAVDNIVGFRFQNSWQQVPVQIDERKYIDFGTVYNVDPVGIETIAYADSNTYVGPDIDPNFDSDDELVFMAKDAGKRALGCPGLPSGVLVETGLEVEIYDSLEGGFAYVYLFESDGSLASDANQDYVTYTFELLAGSYIPHYSLMVGPNPEDSEAYSGYYRTHFSDRWIRDGLNIFEGDSTGVDILDRHKNMFGPGNCARTENTFSNGEGAFFANKDGPVRAIRSYMGANSGPLSQREHFFYGQRQDITTFLRVHAIPGVMDLYDYSPNANGMYYYNDLNRNGVLVNGQFDSVTPGQINWEMLAGPQGSLVISHSVETDINSFSYTSYYSDDSTPAVTQCTGDDYEYATSGLWINSAIPNTDPSQGTFNSLSSRRILYYEAPNKIVNTTILRHLQAGTPLEVAVYRYESCPADFDNDNDIDMQDYASFALHWNDQNCVDPNWCEDTDFNKSSRVDFFDLAAFVEYWLIPSND
jgi:hypothetical protein